MLKRVIAQDANVLVVAKAANAIALLARGMRAQFAPAAKALVSAVCVDVLATEWSA